LLNKTQTCNQFHGPVTQLVKKFPTSMKPGGSPPGSQVADGGDGIHMWRAAANVLQSDSRRGGGLMNLHRKKKCYIGPRNGLNGLFEKYQCI